MTRTGWIIVLVAVLAGAGIHYANDAGYLRGAKASYAGWAESQRLERDAREGRNEKPTLFDMAKDAVARTVPGR